MTRDEFQSLYDSGTDNCFLLFQRMEATIAALTIRVQELEDRISRDSHNSSKPPSSDGMRKTPKSLRQKSDKSSGGQKGHVGTTLCLSDTPNTIVVHTPSHCQQCGNGLESVASHSFSRRQVYDLPPLSLVVTEHRTFKKVCPGCQSVNEAPFPEGVPQSVQYGTRLKAICVYLQQYQLLPFQRTQELLSDLCGCPISEGTLANCLITCHEQLADVESRIKRAIHEAPVGHFDETGIRIQKRLHWLHTASTTSLTFLSTHAKRGKAALDAIGILPNFRGTAIHDAFASYFGYSCSHGLCNAHLLRELLFFKEQKGYPWAEPFLTLLLCIKESVQIARSHQNSSLSTTDLTRFEENYQALLDEGLQMHPEMVPSGKRGRPKQSPAHNLLMRLTTHRKAVLRFMYDFRVCFDNNQAERDLRMAKVRQKISGCFRSCDHAQIFCRIRGYISTLRKQGISVMMALQRAFQGDPIIPSLLTE